MKQFSIRDLMLLIGLVAVALGWWIDRHNRAAVPARYQLQVSGDYAIVLDTATGQVWDRHTSGFMSPKIVK
jgi:hypothetical protein